VLIRAVSKEDYKDLKSFAQAGSQRLLKNLVDAEPKFEDVQVKGKPAIRVTAEGTMSNGRRRGYLMTFLDTDGMFVDIIGIAPASAYKSMQQILADMAGGVKIVSAAAAPAAQPAPVQPATPPATSPPPGRQPPAGRQPR
jgi:hypothetical protein